MPHLEPVPHQDPETDRRPIDDSSEEPMSTSYSVAADPAPAPSAALAVPPLGSRRGPWIAAALACFPGLGSVYNGSYARGAAFFLAVFGTMHLADSGEEIFGMAVAFLWLFNIIDAYREARLIRAGLASDVEAGRARPRTSAAEGIGLGALLVLLGVVSQLDILGWDVEWIYDLWPLAMIAAGAWFVVTAIRRVRAASRARASSGPPAA